jgi:hypothetical protein
MKSFEPKHGELPLEIDRDSIIPEKALAHRLNRLMLINHNVAKPAYPLVVTQKSDNYLKICVDLRIK